MADLSKLSDAELMRLSIATAGERTLQGLSDEELLALTPRYAEASPIPERQAIPTGSSQMGDIADIEMQPPGASRFMTAQPSPEFTEAAGEYLPMAAGIGAAIPTGGMSIPAQSAIAGAATGGADLLAQLASGDDISLNQSAKSAAWATAGTAAFGTLFKLAFPGKATPTELDKAREYAREHNLPRPLTMAGKGGATTGRGSVLGEAEYGRQLGNFSKALDEYISTFNSKVTRPIDEIVDESKDFLSNLFSKRAGFEKTKELIGADTPIDIAPLYSRIDDLILEVKGQGGGDLLGVLQNIKEAAEGGVSSVRTFDAVDGLFGKVLKAADTSTHQVGAQVRALLDESINSSVNLNPALVTRLGGADEAVKLIKQSYQDFHQISRILKAHPELRTLMSGRTSSTKFLKHWSESKAARDAIKEISPQSWQELNEAWIARNINRHVYGKVNPESGRAAVQLRGDKFVDFLSDNKSAVEDMFGTSGYEGLQNLGYYLKHSESYGRGARQMPLFEAAGRLGTEVWALGPAGATSAEMIGFTLVHQLMAPNSILNRALITAPRVARTVMDRPGTLGAAVTQMPGAEQPVTGPLGFSPGQLTDEMRLNEPAGLGPTPPVFSPQDRIPSFLKPPSPF